MSVKPYFESDGVAIYHGDCREILPVLGEGFADAILTDPPYGIAYVTNYRSRRDKLRKAVAHDENLDVAAEAWPAVMAALKDDRHWYAFASPRMIGAAQAVFGGKQIIAWDKGDRGTVGDLECGFGEAWEAIFYGMKGRRPLNGKRPRTVMRYDWSSTMDPVHPTVKPIPLLQRLVAMSANPGELILDPFCGSGTTLAAAKNQGCRAVGIELDERYCEIAAGRLEQGVFSW